MLPFFPTTILASYEALPLLSYSPAFFSPVFLCLPSDAHASIFQHVSVCVAEVTQVNSISVSPIQEASNKWLLDPLHEVVQCQSSPAS
jgi:hypothetical protein